jgi:outer membrane protein TolC
LRLAKKAASHRVSRGLTTRTDVLEFARYEDIAAEQIDILKQEQKQLSMTLATQLGEKTDIIITENHIPNPDDKNLQTALLSTEKQPDLAKLRSEIMILTMEKEKLSLRNLPRIDIYNTYTAYTFRDRAYTNITDRFDVATGIRLYMPLFDSLQSEKESAAMDHRITAKSQLLEQQRTNLQRMIKSTQAQLRYLDQATQRSQKRIAQTGTFVNATLIDYDHGIKNASDVRNAIETYFQDKTESTQRRLKYQLTKVDLLALSTDYHFL